jgi:hypothetical protein
MRTRVECVASSRMERRSGVRRAASSASDRRRSREWMAMTNRSHDGYDAITRTGKGAEYGPVPRKAWVSSADGFTNARSSSPRATACDRIGEPGAMRSDGVKASPDALPITRLMSRLP